jgi:predicted RecB family nuclease
MATEITRDLLESHLRCRTKAFLKLRGEQGTRSDYEALLMDVQGEVSSRAVAKILARHAEGEVLRGQAVTLALLKRGAPYVLDCTLEAGGLCLAFDGLKKVAGPSRLGDFHYAPILFHGGEKVRQEQRLLLGALAFAVGQLQGREPGVAVVFHGKGCRASRVRLTDGLREKARSLLREVERLRPDDKPPRLILNGHCPACEFRQRCQEQADQEDVLSLLRGMGEKEVRGYARKGIFTVTQLAHTFRPRRKAKRVRGKERHSYPLQALAIRDRKTYVLGAPQLPDAPVRVFLDLEGKPEEDFVYLVGAIVAADGSETRYSFWADGPGQEAQIFEQFLAVLQPYADFRVYCYGAYELDFLKRMRKQARRKRFADRVLASTVNVLSVIYAHVHFPVHSNGLKQVGRHLGCSWAEPDASGLQSLVWRAGWERTADEAIKQKLLAYNLDDCAALKRVTEFLFQVAAGASSVGEPAGGPPPGPRLPDVQDADRLTFPRPGAPPISSTPISHTSPGARISTTSGSGSMSGPARCSGRGPGPPPASW